MRKGSPHLRISTSASSCDAVQSLFSPCSARSGLITSELRMRSQPRSTVAALATNSRPGATAFGSLMPGGMLWAWITMPTACEMAAEAWRRVALSRPGLRFCGMALDA